jgi:hypothetical protein
VNIATLGTAAAVLLALHVAFLAARKTTFNRGTYLLARLLIVVSRSVDSSRPHDGGWISLVRSPAVDYLRSARTKRSGGYERGRPLVE